MATHLPTSMRVFIVMAFTIGTVPPWAHAVKYAFVTSETTDGSIDETGSAPGIASANAICTRLANSAGSIIPVPNQAGPWRAWLSDARSSPLTTFTLATVAYLRPGDNPQIAANWSGLISGIVQPLRNTDEQGIPPPQVARTGTPASGTVTPGSPRSFAGRTHRSVGLRLTRNVRPPPPHRSLDGRHYRRGRNAIHQCTVSSRGQSQWN